MANKYTPFNRAKKYAPDKSGIDKIAKNIFGKKYVDNPKGKGGKTDV